MNNTIRLFIFASLLFIATIPLPAQWIQTSGPSDAWVSALAANGTTLFAGTAHPGLNEGNVFRSTDYGVNWGSPISGIPYKQVQSFAISDTNIFVSTVFGGVYRSTNNGTSWTAANNGLSTLDCYPLVAKGTNLFVGAYWAGVFRSTDNGANWTSVGLGSQFPWSFAVSGNNLFAGCSYASGHSGSGGVYRSTDNGDNWTAASTGLPANTFVSGLAVIGTDLFAATYGAVYRSTNNGDNWVSVSTGLSDSYSIISVGTNLFVGSAAHGVGPFLSTNNGTSWTEVNTGLPTSSGSSGFFAIIGTNLYLGSYGEGVWKRPLSEMIPSTDTTTTWRMQLQASIASSLDNENYLGTSDNATDGQDAIFDVAEPPVSPGSYVSLFFPHPEWGSILGNNFAKDVKKNTSLADTVKRWYFQVTSNIVNDTITLSFVNDRIPASFGKYLTDLKTGNRINLKNTSQYKYFNSDTTRSFMLIIGDTTSPSLTLTSPNGSNIWRSGTSKNIQWSTNDGTGIDSVFVYSSSNGGTSYSLLKSLGYVQTTPWTIPSEYLNNNYSIKIVSRDSLGNQAITRSSKTFTVVGDSLAKSNSAGWSLVSVPLTPNDSSVTNMFGATSYLWSYIQASGYTQPSKITLGNGYWLGVTATKNWFVNGIANESDSSVQNLQLGYNLIGSNFVRNVSKSNLFFIKSGSYYSFSSAVTAGLITNTLYGYSASAYSSIDTMSPFGGYWIGVLQSGVQLIQKPNVSIVTPLAKQTQILASNWELPIKATSGSMMDNVFTVGIKPSTTNDFDALYDAPRPPRNPGADYLELYSSNVGGDYPSVLGQKYARDYRDSSSASWSFMVESGQTGDVSLSWDNSFVEGLAGKVQLILTDNVNTQSVDMSTTNSYTFTYSSPHNFTINATLTSVNDRGEGVPLEFSLSQSYPNPFNPDTKISYSVSKAGYVSLIIYDVLGREVAKLIQENKQPGEYTATWNADGVPSGVYFYRLSAGDFIQTKKMVLMR